MLQKMKHYAYFEWTQFTVDQELFPSTMGHEGSEYLLIVYVNADGIHAISCAEENESITILTGPGCLQEDRPAGIILSKM